MFGEPSIGSGQIVKPSVELGFEGGVRPMTDFGSGWEAEGEQVTAEEDGTG